MDDGSSNVSEWDVTYDDNDWENVRYIRNRQNDLKAVTGSDKRRSATRRQRQLACRMLIAADGEIAAVRAAMRWSAPKANKCPDNRSCPPPAA